MSDILAVNEIFGPTFQGEGQNAGMPCVFLRLAGCNLSCVWCDTPYTWDWTRFNSRDEIHQMTVAQVYQRLNAYDIKSLVISGGEPMLQQKNLYTLTKILRGEKWHVEIETAGTVEPLTTELVDLFTVSPKLYNSGNKLRKRYKPDALKSLSISGRAVFKFVVSSMNDFPEIDSIVERHNMQKVYIMPEGKTQTIINEHLSEIADAAINRGYWLSNRLHVQLYGDRRGV